MKNSVLSTFSIITLCLSSFFVNAQNNVNNQNNPTDIVQVIDFHSTHRCMTCNAIEKQAKSTLNKYYKTELDKGLITFQTVNVDEENNYEMAEEFEAAGTALFINVVKNGNSTKIDLTEFAFMNVNDESGAFEKGFRIEMDKALGLL